MPRDSGCLSRCLAASAPFPKCRPFCTACLPSGVSASCPAFLWWKNSSFPPLFCHFPSHEKSEHGLTRYRYAEGIDLLYSTNEFRFHDFFTLKLFPSLVLPKRFARISAIAFSWDLPVDSQPHTSTTQQRNYDAVWEFLGSACPGLRTLRIFLQALGLSNRGDKTVEEFQRAWLEPINKLESLNLQAFEIYTPRSFYFRFKDVANRELYDLIEIPHQGLVYGSMQYAQP